MIPEVVVAMLACARIGAPHNVVFGGFAPSAVRERMEVSQAKALNHHRRRAPPGQDRAGQAGRGRGHRRAGHARR
jgi:acyl-coenzyme A synthetase/AMP-(fatty) acid ligase